MSSKTQKMEQKKYLTSEEFVKCRLEFEFEAVLYFPNLVQSFLLAALQGYVGFIKA